MTTTTQTNQRKMLLTTAGVLAFGVAAYGLGRVFPPMGPSAGTITAADRYVSSQVSESDVALGDTAVPELMQTDAFELMTKDPNFRALAASPGFQALASQPQVMAALMANPRRLLRLPPIPGRRRRCASVATDFLECPNSARETIRACCLLSSPFAALEGLARHPAALAAISAMRRPSPTWRPARTRSRVAFQSPRRCANR